MTTPTSIESLLERLESEIHTADGRTARVCRDERGNCWVIDGAERIVPLSEFASDCAVRARHSCERERAQAMRELGAAMKRGIGRIVRAFGAVAKPARA
jgi:hypothetical protein